MKTKLLSDSHTSDNRNGDSNGVTWCNYQGNKDSREVEVTQVNSKNADGDHFFYNPKTGVQGVALGGAERKGK